MPRQESHRSRSRSPGRRRTEDPARHKRKRDNEKQNGVRERPADASNHAAKRRRSSSPEASRVKRGMNGTENRSAPRHPKTTSHDEPRERTRRDSRRSRSRSPTRHVEESKHSVRHRSPPRGPRSGRAERPPPHDRDQKSNLSKSVKVPDPLTTATVFERRRRKDAVQDDEDIEVEYVIDEGADQFRDQYMGFVQFRSTKNTKVPGNNKLYGVRKEKKTEYRQYMNRIGGFNRPLSPSYV